jgi:hypothetical protein
MLQSIAYYEQETTKKWLKENYYGYIYLTYDQKTGLSYVGKRKAKIEDSKDYYGSGTIIQRIIKKRGAYFLKKIILGICFSAEELLECETECKKIFNVLDLLYGYNIVKRDNGGWDSINNHPDKKLIIEKGANTYKKRYSNGEIQVWNKNLTKETDGRIAKYAEAQSKKMKGRPSPRKGKDPWNKNLTKETDERIAKAAETRSKSMKGIKFTEEHIKNIKITKKIEGEKRKGSKWMYNEKDEIKTILKEEIDLYISLGWRFGRNDISPCRNRIWINKDNVGKMINKEEIDYYLNLGWNLGSNKRGKK